MKKILSLLVLSSALVLAGCNSGEATTTATSGEPATNTVTSTPTGTTALTTTSEPQEHSVTFNLSGQDLPFENYSVQLGGDSDSNRDTLRNSVNTKVGFELVSSISANTISILTDNGQKDKAHFHVTVGSSSTGGSLELGFSVPVHKVVVSCQAYYKTYSGGQTIDTNAKLYIDGEGHSLEAEEGVVPTPIKVFEKVYETYTNTVELYNNLDHQRVFIESVEVIY